MVENYLELDCFEGIDSEMVKEEIAKSPVCKDIISGIWKLEEEMNLQSKTPRTPQEQLKQYVNLTRDIKGKDSKAYRIWAWWVFGIPMITDQEKLSFREDSEIKVKVVVLDLLYNFIEYSFKANEIAKFLGLESIGPFTRNRQTSGWSKGGEEKRKNGKDKKEELRKKCKSLFAEIKKRSPNLSPNSIDKKIASLLDLSPSYIYQLRTDRK